MQNLVPNGIFGPGSLWLTRTDIATQTPVNVGFCNEFSTAFKFGTKQLYGQRQMPLLVARGTGKLTGKIKAAVLSGMALNAILLGGTVTAGTQYDATTTGATAIPATPYQITPTVPSSGTWNSDLGVLNAATNEPLTLVANPPTAGQYSVADGVYTFSTADHGSGISVIISFSYSFTAAVGQNIVIPNNLIGDTPTFQIDYKSTLFGSTYYLRIYQAVCSSWDMSHKLEDFAMPELDFEFMDNGSGNIGLLSLATQG